MIHMHLFMSFILRAIFVFIRDIIQAQIEADMLKAAILNEEVGHIIDNTNGSTADNGVSIFIGIIFDVCVCLYMCVCVCVQGRIQDFHLGGGGGGARKRLCASTHITSAEPNSLSEGVQGPALGLF